jgi:hypothetical protein
MTGGIVLQSIGWLAGAGVVAIGALLYWRLRKTRAALAAVAAQCAALQEQMQRDLLAMGQRVIEVDKLARRFSERLDALENERPAAPRYGQLEALLQNVAQQPEAETASAAEAALLALLRRNSTGGG